MPLVFAVGPPAVGEMTVGHARARRTGLRLFHDHVTSDVVTRFFDYGTPAYGRLVREFRTRIFEDVARLAETFRVRGRPVYLAELEAPLAVRLNSAGEFATRPDCLDGYVRAANTDLSPGDAAARIAAAFALPHPGAPRPGEPSAGA